MGDMMIDVFSKQYTTDSRDSELVVAAQQGNRAAFEELILRHQGWMYNIALRMVGNKHDAEDVTQEILLKVLTKLSTFQGKSDFRAWLYRIVANHVMNMKKRAIEYVFSSFERHDDMRRNMLDMDVPDRHSVPADVTLLVEETKLLCMMGMLLCLDRSQRLVFILGGIFGITSELGAEIMEMSPANFRQQLSRARKHLTNYMNDNCGLMNKENPCRCARKTRAVVEAGYVDPQQVVYRASHVQRVKALVSKEAHCVDGALELRTQNVFRDHPFQASPNYARMLEEMLNHKEYQEFINFN
jgi:RNA polymerase sigma factor (sigma-70 family)